MGKRFDHAKYSDQKARRIATATTLFLSIESLKEYIESAKPHMTNLTQADKKWVRSIFRGRKREIAEARI